MKNSRILIVDDDDTLCYLLKEELISEGYNVEIVYHSDKAIDFIKKTNHDLLLLDLEMDGISGLEILKYVKENHPDLQVIVLTANNNMRTAIECIKNGAYDFINKPYQFEQLQVSIERALAHKDLMVKNTVLTTRINQTAPHKIIGESEGIKNVIHLAEKAARADSNILLQGETGTGKELFAEYVHKCSNRSEKPFVAINCASLPDQLIESELFGYVKGAYTGANTTEKGIVESAEKGTLVFDKVEFLPLDLQQKLIDFIEKKEFRRVGGREVKKIDLKLIFTTQKNLFEEIGNNKMLDAFYYRISTASLNVPPLRKRKNDIPMLANYLIKKNSSKLGYKTNLISSVALLKLMEYDFPGNIRELENILIQSSLISDSDVIKLEHLCLNTNKQNVLEREISEKEKIPCLSKLKKEGAISLDDELKIIEKALIEEALSMTGGQQVEASRLLNVSERSMRYRIGNLKINRKDV